MTMELREIVLEGHVIDSWVLPKVLDLIMDLEGDFEFILPRGQAKDGEVLCEDAHKG